MLREPLLHFLAAGVLIFALYGLFGGRGDADARRIEIGPAQVDRLTQVFAAQWRRPPTDAEIAGLIEQQVEEEVLYREALALGLDQDDSIVRRRLAQKMQFMIEDTTAPPTPTEADLEEHFRVRLEDFRTAPYLRFTHVYFSTDRRADAEQVARDVLPNLGTLERAPERGDAFMLRFDYADISRSEVARLFGAEFAKRLFELPTGAWQGPVRSAYGYHLVRIAAKTLPPEPEFAAVREGVLASWLDAARRRTNDETLAAIRAGYEIVIAPSSPAGVD